MSKPMFQRSVETEELIKFLRGKPVGEVVKYGHVSDVARRTKAEGLGGLLRTAIRALWGEHVFFAVVRGVGIVRVDDADALGVVATKRTRIQNAARAGRRQLSAIQYDTLSLDKKIIHNVHATMLALHSRIEAKKSVERLTCEVEKSNQKLGMAEAAIALLRVKQEAKKNKRDTA